MNEEGKRIIEQLRVPIDNDKMFERFFDEVDLGVNYDFNRLKELVNSYQGLIDEIGGYENYLVELAENREQDLERIKEDFETDRNLIDARIYNLDKRDESIVAEINGYNEVLGLGLLNNLEIEALQETINERNEERENIKKEKEKLEKEKQKLSGRFGQLSNYNRVSNETKTLIAERREKLDDLRAAIQRSFNVVKNYMVKELEARRNQSSSKIELYKKELKKISEEIDLLGRLYEQSKNDPVKYPIGSENGPEAIFWRLQDKMGEYHNTEQEYKAYRANIINSIDVEIVHYLKFIQDLNFDEFWSKLKDNNFSLELVKYTLPDPLISLASLDGMRTEDVAKANGYFREVEPNPAEEPEGEIIEKKSEENLKEKLSSLKNKLSDEIDLIRFDDPYWSEFVIVFKNSLDYSTVEDIDELESIKSTEDYLKYFNDYKVSKFNVLHNKKYEELNSVVSNYIVSGEDRDLVTTVKYECSIKIDACTDLAALDSLDVKKLFIDILNDKKEKAKHEEFRKIYKEKLDELNTVVANSSEENSMNQIIENKVKDEIDHIAELEELKEYNVKESFLRKMEELKKNTPVQSEPATSEPEPTPSEPEPVSIVPVVSGPDDVRTVKTNEVLSLTESEETRRYRESLLNYIDRRTDEELNFVDIKNLFEQVDAAYRDFEAAVAEAKDRYTGVYQKEQVRRKDFDTRKEYKDAKNLENQKADNYFISDKEYESLIKNAQKVFELKMNALGMDSVWELYATDDFDEINEQEVGRADNTILISKTDSKFKQWVKSFVGSKKMQLIAGCSRLVSNFDNRFKNFANMYGLKSSSDIDTFDNVINSTYGETEAQQYIDNYVDPEGRRRR